MPGIAKAPKARKNEARGDYLSRATSALYGAGTKLPATRKAIALALGEDPSGNGLLGSVDPIYYRLVGLASPLPVSGKTPRTRESSLLRAIRTRRDSGVRWEVLRGSIEATIGRAVSDREAKALYVGSGGDLLSSYVGRGTRVAAPKTYRDVAAPAKIAAAK